MQKPIVSVATWVNGGHAIDAPVAARAAEAVIDVDRMVEIDKFGELMDSIPGDRRTRGTP
jgi:hypothetical protein